MEISDFVKELNAVINPDKNISAEPATNSIVQSVASSAATPKTVKVMIVSTHINQVNGYSKVVTNIINQLSANNWIKIVHFGTQVITNGNVGRKYPNGVKSIDGSALEKQKALGYAFSELPATILAEKPDVVFIYNDIAVVCGYIEEIRKAIQNRFFKIYN